jgi:uncharacterized protein (UPF0276 family)
LIAEASQYCPVAVHFTLGAGNRQLSKVDLQQVEALKQKTGTPFVNVHLAPSVDYFPDIPVDTTQPSMVWRIVDAMRADLRYLVDRFGAENVIAENIPYRGLSRKHFLRPCVDPEIICDLLEEVNCGFLFDIPHARISAHHLGIDEMEYINLLKKILHQILDGRSSGDLADGIWIT